ncbi:hypothetical protein BJP34_35715 (plasmid) [Moorena producens PAL-8-15-08-1]|uniref:Uncharacterized protein n=1 Tax=Moorena producens PAL-8-15-08-1 TaxID=1458985 RepID=A0A1D8U491_9CYAN|nr:hypothetical protein [Moorena producens]AOX04729.1 hypothetical protein BJP34_35715 [Moorena producens PAL-8-15-08-1]
MDYTKIMDYTEILKKALDWGQENHPESNLYRHAAFANSVAYLVTGGSGGYGGPSIREHCVSHALAGDGFNVPTDTNIGVMTVQFPDGRLPRGGEWSFQKACEFAEPICYGILPAIAVKVYQTEYCSNDDPEDLKEIENRQRNL